MQLYNIHDIDFYASEQRIENMKTRRVYISKEQVDSIYSLAGNTNLDIGAHVGYFSLIMAKKGKVIAFEPHPNNYNILISNCRLNKNNPIIPFNCAIGDFVHDVNLYQCNFNDGMHRIYKSKYCEDSIKVKMQRIDNIVFEGVNFIKIDTEGSELGVFKGMEKTLESSHPTIMFEFHPPSTQECGNNPKDIYDLLLRHGYNDFRFLDGEQCNSYDYIEKRCTNNIAENIICS